jgi:Ca2+-binding RTX toxin-like protein
MNAAAFLNPFNITVDDALSFVLSKANDPQGLFNVLRSVGMNNAILTEVVQKANPAFTSAQVRGFFASLGLDSNELERAYFELLRAKLPLQTLGSQNDIVSGTESADYIDAGIGNDSINGLAGDDLLIGGSGDDSVIGGWGADYLEGGLGADRLEAGRHHTIKNTLGYYEGNIWIPGTSVTEYDLSSNMLLGGGGSDRLYGGYGADLLEGGDGADEIWGYEGSDTISGGGGDDTIRSNGILTVTNLDDNDVIDGGDGNDVIYGGYGRATITGGSGNDTIYANQMAEVDGGTGDDEIRVEYVQGAARVGVFKGGEGSDKFRLSDLQAGSKAIIDLTETISTRDVVLSWSTQSGLVEPVAVVQGFQKGFDQFQVGSFRAVGSNSLGIDSAANFTTQGLVRENYAQIVQSSTDVFKARLSSPKTPDDYGKGFFAVQGQAAAQDDIVTVARFLDAYGNNHTYTNSVSHYFLINVGESDMALYLFRDDTGADNNVVADELTPIVRFLGVRTEELSATDLANIFI